MTLKSRPIGIMQGRLSPKSIDNLQSFPYGCWQEEFSRAEKLGFETIEWLFCSSDPILNPLMTPEGRREVGLVSVDSGISVETMCLHYFIDGQLWVDDKLARKSAIETLEKMLDFGAEIGAKVAVLPAMGPEGSLSNPDRAKRARDLLVELDGSGKLSCALAIEADISAKFLNPILSDVNSDRVGVCFDTGNVTALGLNIEDEYFDLRDRLLEVHIKDRAVNAGSFLLGQGDTRLSDIGRIISSSMFEGPVVLETPVFDNWETSGMHNLSIAHSMFDGGH